MKHICVFCGSSFGSKPDYKLAAQAIATAMVKRGMGLVYGGGNVGLMGVVADAVLAAGGEAIGVIPEFLPEKEIAHTGLTQLHVVPSMHDRKMMMAELADAFIALPGGFGTLEEFCEIVTWAQLGLHQKPQGLLNVAGYYDPLIALFDQAVTEQFLSADLRTLVLAATESDQLLDLLTSYTPRPVNKWIGTPMKA